MDVTSMATESRHTADGLRPRLIPRYTDEEVGVDRQRPIAAVQPGAEPVTPGTSHGTDPKLDRWADWLVRGRDRGATEVQLRRRRRALGQVRDRVLREARLRPGERVVDLGAGTGLLALKARRREKGSGYVVAVDLCLPLIRLIGLMPTAAGSRDAVHRRAAPSPLCSDSAAAQSEAWVRLSTAINVSASRCSSRRTSTGSLADTVRRSRRRGPGIHVESSRSPARHTRFATASGAQ